MAWKIPADWRTPENNAVVAYLEQASPSAHSDVADELCRAAAGLADVRTHCPASGHYAFVVLIDRDDRIFGLARGMRGLAFRLPEDALDEARADGGADCPDLGEGWMAFEPFDANEPTDRLRARLARWCAVAHGK